jgi:hypothetical protein
VNITINQVTPKVDGVPFGRRANGNTSIKSIEYENVLPSKGSFFFGKMRHNTIIISPPDQSDPLHISLSIEFIQML